MPQIIQFIMKFKWFLTWNFVYFSGQKILTEVSALDIMNVSFLSAYKLKNGDA